ncbi:MAG TPA: DnaB-like helicase C-terminal domain-containing protein [Gemmatimonadaceae bacterium]|nr:DnaB-like helicase C-terminal domain-containing protein [Gemmatimonadaceae bacterium]
MARSSDISPLSVLLTRVDAVTDGSPSSDCISCGFPSVDKMLGGGFRHGDLIVLGGDVGSGKSALALAFAIRASMNLSRTAFLTAEMSAERVLERVIAIEARMRVDDLRQGILDDTARATAGGVALRLRDQLPVIDVLPSAKTLAKTLAKGTDGLAAMLDTLADVDLVVVDSIGALAAGALSAEDEVAASVRGLKTLALERSIAILTTSPLPNLTPRPDRRPTLDDFGGSGCIKQHADVVLGLFRQDMYEPSRDIEGATELLIRKNRNGPIGYVDLYFYSQWMRFEDMLDPDR